MPSRSDNPERGELRPERNFMHLTNRPRPANQRASLWLRVPLSPKGANFRLRIRRAKDGTHRIVEPGNGTLFACAAMMGVAVVGLAPYLEFDGWRSWLLIALWLLGFSWFSLLLFRSLQLQVLSIGATAASLVKVSLAGVRRSMCSVHELHLVAHPVEMYHVSKGDWAGFATILQVGSQKLTLSVEQSAEAPEAVRRGLSECMGKEVTLTRGPHLYAPMNRLW